MSEQGDGGKGAADAKDQAKAAAKIAAHKKRMKVGNPTNEQLSAEQQLMNEMRGNKASLDLNRAMKDYDEEHKNEQPDDERGIDLSSTN